MRPPKWGQRMGRTGDVASDQTLPSRGIGARQPARHRVRFAGRKDCQSVKTRLMLTGYGGRPSPLCSACSLFCPYRLPSFVGRERSLQSKPLDCFVRLWNGGVGQLRKVYPFDSNGLHIHNAEIPHRRCHHQKIGSQKLVDQLIRLAGRLL